MRTLLLILGYMIADSALTDPCEHHTVLDEPWRSTNCSGTECVGDRNWKCDNDLAHGWYRFKSSGGWEIPETRVPNIRCSTGTSGWLNGPHPTVGQREVARTVCFTGYSTFCHWTREIKIKHCGSYFVYELKPAPGCSAAYCTDPKTVPNQEPEEQSTRESTDRSSSSPAGSASSDPETSPTQEPEEQSTQQSEDRTSTIPVVSADSDQETNPTQEPEKQTSQESNEKSSSIPAGSAASDSGKKTSSGAKGESKSEADCKPSEEGHSRPGVPSLSEEECEKGRDEVQVINVRQTNLDTLAKQEAFLRQVRDMLKDHLPCKRFVLKSEDGKN